MTRFAIYRAIGPDSTDTRAANRTAEPPTPDSVSSVEFSAPIQDTETAVTPFLGLGRPATQGASRMPHNAFARDSLAELLDLRTRWRASSVFDPLGMFLLQLVADADEGVPLGEVAEHLRGSAGWLALARLIRAGFVDENGLTVYATPSGRRAAEATTTLVVGSDV